VKACTAEQLAGPQRGVQSTHSAGVDPQVNTDQVRLLQVIDVVEPANRVARMADTAVNSLHVYDILVLVNCKS